MYGLSDNDLRVATLSKPYQSVLGNILQNYNTFDFEETDISELWVMDILSLYLEQICYVS